MERSTLIQRIREHSVSLEREAGDAGILNFLIKYISTVPEITDIPYAPFSLIAFLASEEAVKMPLWKEGHYHRSETEHLFDDLEVPDALDHLSEGSKSTNEFAVCLMTISHAYLMTQFLFRNHFAPIHVDLDALKEAFIRSQSARLEVFDSQVGALVEFIVKLIISESSLKYADSVHPESALEDKGELSILDWVIIRCVMLGAIVWQTTDNLIPTGVRSGIPKKRIFISYSRKDRRKAKIFQNMFEGTGFDVWIDEKDIPVGTSINRRIDQGISKECDYFVILMSEHSLSSAWVAREIDQATNIEIERDCIYLLPVRLDETAVPNSLGIKRYADARRSSRVAFEELLHAIKWSGSHRS
jgi:TIR domain